MGYRIGKLHNYKKMAAIIFVVTFAVVLLVPIFTPTAHAQGTYSCSFDDNRCVVDRDKTDCDDGFYTGICRGGNQADCFKSGGTCSDTIPITGRVINLYNSAMGIGVILALAIIVYGGVRYSASAGSPTGIADAKKWILAAFGGLAILFGAFLILNTINTDLLIPKDPTVPQAETQEASKPSLTLPPISNITCREQCLAEGNTPTECNFLPACPVSNITCREQCFDAGNDPNVCNALPACPVSNITCREQCFDAGNDPNVCNALPLCY